MKKLILGTITILLISFQGQCESETDNILRNQNEVGVIKDIPITVTLSIEFGRGEGCFNKGICKINIEVGLLAGPNTFLGGSTNGNLTLAINDYNLVEIFNHFHESAIVLDANQTISDDLVRTLGLKSNILKAGTYKIVYNQTTRQNEVQF